MRGRVTASRLERRAFVYVRQSTPMQVHEHVESRQRQYALADRAVSLGWQPAEVEVIDEDQGKSGSSSEGRSGFARLADAVAHGQAGAVLAIEVSRLARSSTDWQRLLQVCAVADVVVIDEQSVYDPSDKDDKMLLDLKGTMSEAELHWLRLRLVGGRMNKARRGELQVHPPTGYVWREHGFTLDPDEAVQRAVRLLFERFAVEPTAWAVVRWANEQGVRFPTRRWYADGANKLTWRALTQGATRGAPNRGSALLAGLLVCGRCGRRMRTMYEKPSKPRASYMCLGDHDKGGSICWSVPARTIDEAVEKLFLSKMVPEELDLSLAVEHEADRQAGALEQQWVTRREQVEYEARRAERRYKAVDPDNRVVARTLEREWEEKLREVEEVQRQYEEARRTRHVQLSDEDRARIRKLARDLPAIWRAPTTDNAERKAMLRLVIEAISLSPVEVPRRMTTVRVQWQSGVVSELLVERPHGHRAQQDTLARLQQLVAEGHHDAVVAERLNKERLLTGHLEPWTAVKVARTRSAQGLARVAPRKTYRFLPDRDPETGAYSVPGAARRFGVPTKTVNKWIERGLITVHHQTFGRYHRARWLAIDEDLTATLERLAAGDGRQ